MAKRNVEEQIASLSRLRESPVTEETLAALRKGLGDRVNLVTAKAAQIAGELGLKSMIPELVAALDPLFQNAGAGDPQCWAKNAIVKSLTDLDHNESAPFLQGCRYVQMEPVWGGRVDTAVKLRSLCTLALVQCADLPRAGKLRHLVAAVIDVEEPVRIDALRALEQMEGEEAALLLRLKAGVGDKSATVVGQALESLLRMEGSRALDFARGFLKEREAESREPGATPVEIVEEAALALGASRLPASVEVLKEAWSNDPKIVFLQAISISRQESGLDFLLELVKSGRERDAMSALEVLALQRDSAEVLSHTRAAVEARDSGPVRERFRTKFGPG